MRALGGNARKRGSGFGEIRRKQAARNRTANGLRRMVELVVVSSPKAKEISDDSARPNFLDQGGHIVGKQSLN